MENSKFTNADLFLSSSNAPLVIIPKPTKRASLSKDQISPVVPGDKITEWLKDHPQDAWAIATGTAGGLVVLRIFGKRGRDSLHQLMGQHNLPETLELIGGKTVEYIFRSDQEVAGRIRLYPGISLIGLGYYVLGPGCIDELGFTKTICKGCPDGTPVFAPLPAWITSTLAASDVPTLISNTSRAVPQNIIVAEIKISRSRSLDASKTRILANSIKLVGLINPIQVRATKKGYRLTAGQHRVEAVKLLKWAAIPAVVAKSNKTVSELSSITENLHCVPLSELEEANQKKRWAELVLEARKANNGHVVQKSVGRPKSGTAQLGREMDFSSRSPEAKRKKIERSLKIAKLSPKVQKLAEKLKLDDNQKVLLEVASFPADQQVSRLKKLAKARTKRKHSRTKARNPATYARDLEAMQKSWKSTGMQNVWQRNTRAIRSGFARWLLTQTEA